MFTLIGLTLLFKVINISSSSDASKPKITGKASVEEGDTLNLNCTVDSFPQSIITWSKLNVNEILTNVSGLDTETSILIIRDVTTEDSGQYFCTATHLNSMTQDINITVTKLLEVSGEKTFKEGDTLNLTCYFNGFPQSFVIWTKHGLNRSVSNGTRSATIFINNVTAEDYGQYICAAQHQNKTLTVKVDVTVKYVKTPTITGESTIKKDGVLNLTCTVESFPASVITWTKRGINATLTSETGNGTSTLVIHKVRQEDSGQYFCSANHLNKTLEQNISITVIDEKKLKISGKTMLNEGETLKLICTGGIFSSSVIMWTKGGKNQTLINQTQSNENRSTLVIPNITIEDSGQYLCMEKDLNNTLTEKVDILVINLQKMEITGEQTVREGDALNLTCTVESFHPTLVTWTKQGMSKTLNNETGTKLITSTLIVHNVTTSDSGQYFCTAKYLTTQVQDINITVIYQKTLKISGDRDVTEGHDLNLTCSLDSWTPSVITWTRPGLSAALKESSAAATLLIFNITAEDSGRYICTANHLNITITEEVQIEVKELPTIVDESVCKAQQEVLTCLCVSHGFPSPIITWKLSENHVEYSFTTVVSNHTVKSTLNVKGNPNNPVVCVSSNTNGETSRNLNINKVEDEGYLNRLLRTVTQMGTMIAFLIGVLLSTFIFCSLLLCCRKKRKSNGSTSLNLEMVMTQETNDDHAEEYEPIKAQGRAGGSDCPDAGTSEIEYSDINLLLLNQEISSQAEEKPKQAETDYAKINRKGARTKAEGKEEGEEEMKLCMREAAESEAAAVYSNVINLMDQTKE